MKRIVITEQQFKKLAENLSEANDIDFRNYGNFLSDLSKISPSTETSNTDTATDTPNADASNNTDFASYIPSGNNWMPPTGYNIPFRIDSPFGYRNTGIPGATTNHQGIDIGCPSGTPVYAPLDGIVINAYDTTPNGCGGFVKLNHMDYETKFCHLKQWTVTNGEKVKKGQLIGYSGGAADDPYHGITSGAHLHFEVLDRSGIARDPMKMIPELSQYYRA
jgi:murein DD-endopeptidase MepM/ murein hydrolase activator NlpD